MYPEPLDREVWKGRKVLLTGHTGFKGAWMGLLLQRLGAQVSGVSLPPESTPNLFDILAPWPGLGHHVCDLRNGAALGELVRSIGPDLVIHMAAQAVVMEAYADPLATIDINVMGTVHLLEHLRCAGRLAAVLVVTSDKVYENREAGIDFSENSPLGGHDPYSASKAAVEILTAAYRRSFFDQLGIPLATARAGNVIGGGDWARDRLIPDLWRAFKAGTQVSLRNPESVRPWQHVLDPLYGYLLLLQRCMTSPRDLPAAVNFAPPREPVRTVLQVAEQFATQMGTTALWTTGAAAGARLHESRFLSIDSALAASTLGWHASLPVDEAIRWTCAWYRAHHDGQDMRAFSQRQIDVFAERLQAHALRAP